MTSRFLFLLAISLGGSLLATAQPKKVVADKIVAKVGDKIILHSDIYNAIADYKRQGAEAQLPPNPECMFLEGQLIQKALVLQAQKDSLPVSEEELDALLDNQLRGFIQMYGSKEVVEEVAGKSIYQIKEDFRQPFRERKLADMMRSKIVDNIKVSPTETKAFFDKIPKDSLPFYESELEVSQVVLYPKANRDIEEYVMRELYELKRQVETGQKKFDQLAKLYSDDPAVKENSGQYSLNRNDKQWDPTFLRTAFQLKEGQISSVVKSKFGYHIIQMVSRAGEDAIVRHILKIPEITEGEIATAKQKMDSIRSTIVAGNISFSEAVNRHSEDESSKFSGGALMNREGSTYLTIDQLDKDLVVALKNLKLNQVSQPLAFTDERGRKAVRIVVLKSKSEPHRMNLKDDYNKVAELALDQKRQAALEKWFNDKIPSFYIQIDDQYNNCQNISQWLQSANKGNTTATK